MARTYEQMQTGGSTTEGVGAAMQEWTRVIEQYNEIDTKLLGFSVRLPRGLGEDALITVRADIGGERVVGFVSGDTVASALQKVVNLLKRGKVVFKEDPYG